MRAQVTPATIPGGDPARVTVFLQAAEPGRIAIALSVQEEAIGRGGIVRDEAAPYMIVDGPTGRVRVDDPLRFRDEFLPVLDASETHLTRFEARRPGRMAIAVAGCGNLLCNRGVEARTERGRIGIPGFTRAGVLVEPDGRGRLFQDAALARELATAASPYGSDRFLITGPLLVAAGRAAEPDAREYADLRHLLLPPYVPATGGGRVDFGLDALARDPALAQAAVAGRPITIGAGAGRSGLADALREKGYREALAPEAPGTYRIDGPALTIAFLPGIYPHHALAIAEDGAVTSAIVTGRSNREGTTIRGFAAALAAGGARDAILLDNGGDVGLLRRAAPDAAAPLAWIARPAESDRVRAWPQRACLVYHAARRG